MMNEIAVNTDVQIFTWTYILIFLGYIPKNEKARSYDGYMIKLFFFFFYILIDEDCLPFLFIYFLFFIMVC